MLKPITREEWVKALRSGKYEQGKSLLKNRNKFCCLGVACDLAGVAWEDCEQPSLASSDFKTVGADILYKSLSLTVEEAERLANLNDRNVTFLEIADLIENGPIPLEEGE